LDSLGCKLNQAEMEDLARQFAGAGCTLVSAAEQADIYILNTCTVTHIADRKSRHLLRLAHRRNPGARLVVTGCYAERVPGDLAGIVGVDLVVGNERKSEMLRILDEAGYLPGLYDCSPASNQYADGRIRAMVKIQDGCTSFCSYCIVPLVRRGEKSVPDERIISEISKRVAGGYQEVVLTGTRVGSYDYSEVDLATLLKRILAQTDVCRLRLSSLQPQEISPGLLHLWQDRRLCPHFHLSLQSGSDSVLGRMRRRYTGADYRRAVALIRERVPEVAITTDVIVGFPGETGAEFEESYDFCRQMQFARIHVFPYSAREGTDAARMPQRVADEIKKQRSDKMLTLAEETAASFRRQFYGKMVPVLWEARTDNNIWSGLTENYIRVYTESSANLANRVTSVKLT